MRDSRRNWVNIFSGFLLGSVAVLAIQPVGLLKPEVIHPAEQSVNEMVNYSVVDLFPEETAETLEIVSPAILRYSVESDSFIKTTNIQSGIKKEDDWLRWELLEQGEMNLPVKF